MPPKGPVSPSSVANVGNSIQFHEYFAADLSVEQALSWRHRRYQMSSGMSFTFTASWVTLELNAGGNAVPLLYENVRRGDLRSYVAMVDGEIEFVPAPSRAMTTVLWHQHEGEQGGKRR
jgi:hypothetical protein